MRRSGRSHSGADPPAPPSPGTAERHAHMPDESTEERSLIRAAQYIRMSTEHQQYSTENQADTITEYAIARGYEVVRTYADEGKSGLRVQGRDALKRMLDDVQAGQIDFEAILVYDVSRWGRFQDSDESAYYEYICKRAGLQVEYCAEQFENDGSPVSTIVKGVKRAMAGEYSRELSAKVFKGQCRLIQMGYRQGGPAGFGLRRMLIDQAGEPKAKLKRGEQKSLQTDRVILVPGPEDEVEVVRSMYRMFLENNHSEKTIAQLLNDRGVATDSGQLWSRGSVHQVLTNEKYIGNNVWNRVSFKLKKNRVVNSPEMWVRREGAFDSLVDPEAFFTVRGIIQERGRRFTDVEMVERLRSILTAHGYLSGALIDDAEGLPSSAAYRSRFGSLVRAYQMAGYTPDRNFEYIEINRRLRQVQPNLLGGIVQDLETAGASIEHNEQTNLLTINGLYSASMVLSRCRQTPTGSLRWLVRIGETTLADVVIVVRMDPANDQPSDYYLIPRLEIDWPKLLLHERNGAHIDTYRFDTLAFFLGMAVCARIVEAA